MAGKNPAPEDVAVGLALGLGCDWCAFCFEGGALVAGVCEVVGECSESWVAVGLAGGGWPIAAGRFRRSLEELFNQRGREEGSVVHLKLKQRENGFAQFLGSKVYIFINFLETEPAWNS